MPTPISKSPPIFQAQWPKEPPCSLKKICYKVMRVVWNILSVIIFPIGLIRLTIWWVKERAFLLGVVPGGMGLQKEEDVPESFYQLVKLILHGIFFPHYYKTKMIPEGNALVKEFGGNHIAFKTPDGAHLKGAFFPGEKHPEKVILYAFGNGMQWENEHHSFPGAFNGLRTLHPLGTSFMMVNPRGVGHSRGSSYEKGYAFDTYSAYEYLIKTKGIDPENILLVGFSMGGAYGTCGASLIQKKYPNKKISAINIRSFSDLRTEIQNVLYNKHWLLSTARVVAKCLVFDMNVEKYWRSLKGKKCIFYHSRDQVIPYVASLAKTILEKPDGTKVFKMHEHGDDNPHMRGFCSSEERVLKEKIVEILKLGEEDISIREGHLHCNLEQPLQVSV